MRKEFECNYTIGDLVTVVDNGEIYSTYREAYEKLGLDYNNRRETYNHDYKNEVFVVKGFVLHESEACGVIVGIENNNGCLCIGPEGLRPIVNYLKPMVMYSHQLKQLGKG